MPQQPEKLRVFLSYRFAHEPFIARVHYLLKTQPWLDPFYYTHDQSAIPFPEQIEQEIDIADGFVMFLGDDPGLGQQEEIERALVAAKTRQLQVVPVFLGPPERIHRFLRGIVDKHRYNPLFVPSPEEAAAAQECARQITGRLVGPSRFNPYDDLPIGYPFDYEKSIVNEYKKGDGTLPPDLVALGCPPTWPSVARMPAKHSSYPNPLGPIAGSGDVYRDQDDEVMVDARVREKADGGGDGAPTQTLRFPEAGLRRELTYPPPGGHLRVGVLVAGGIAPGINAVISSIVERHCLYAKRSKQVGKRYQLEVRGYLEGFRALLGQSASFLMLNDEDRPEGFVRAKTELGGSMLLTSRAQELLDRDPTARSEALHEIVRTLKGLHILYVIAGDGGMKAAHAIWTIAQSQGVPLSVVAIPKTMDNDVLWVWQSFGFLSAVEKAKEAILQLHTEATSNPRVCVIQLFGSDSGFVCSHAALASGVIDAILIPEVQFSLRKLSPYVKEVLQERFDIRAASRHQPYAMILMAENAIPTDVKEYRNLKAVGLDGDEKRAIQDFLDNKRRVQGQTPDALRSAGLKIVTRVLERDIRALDNPYWHDFRVFSNEPRHLIRAIPPSVSDVIIGQRLGALAVDNAMAGYTDFMISQWLTEYVLVPLKLVVLGRKRVPKAGFFSNAVVANTGQPDFAS